MYLTLLSNINKIIKLYVKVVKRVESGISLGDILNDIRYIETLNYFTPYIS